jgi:hypothetical protein
LLNLVSTKSYKNKNKKKYYFDKYNLSIRSAHLDYHIKAIDYALNNNITPSENKLLQNNLIVLNSLKNQKKVFSFVKLSLALRKLILKNIRILKKKDRIKTKTNKKNKIKYFIKKSKNTYLNKKSKQKNLKLKSFLDVLKNTNFKNKNYLVKNKSFNKKLYLKQQRILTKFKLNCIISGILSKFYNTHVTLKIVNFVESYKNNKIKNKIYSRNKKKKVFTILKKNQKFTGRNYKKKRNKLIKPLKKLLEKKIKNRFSSLNLKINKKTKNVKKLFTKAIKKTYLNKLKTILKKKINKTSNPSP